MISHKFRMGALQMAFRTAAIVTLLFAFAGFSADLPPGIDPAQAGEELARELRSSAPEESDEFTGSLHIYKPGSTNVVPIHCKIAMRDSGWAVTYETKGAGPQPPQRLVIEHAPGKPNVYRYAEGKDLTNLRALKTEELTLPLAGSDFYLMDLGLEFFHWPKQRLVKTEMRRSRSCRVLESTASKPLPGGYLRVLSWIDYETHGLLNAEAFDEKGNDFKQFEVGSFKKIRGKYQLQNVKIRNRKAKTRTDLQFNLEPK